jgi:ABC-type sugar transport system ATPase subunit
MLPSPALLSLHQIHKSFPGVHALRGVDLNLRAGEVLALVGENGAGKSTLVKLLAGVYLPDVGHIMIDGHVTSFHNPNHARRAGIAVIYQEFNLIPSLSAAANIFLGQEHARFGWLRQREERRQARVLFQRIGVHVDPAMPCRDLTVAQQQVVEIAKALATNARLLVMDEPSAALTPQEVAYLFAVIAELKSQDLGIIYISHRLEEVLAIADQVMVLRDGKHIATKSADGVNREQLIEMMVGRRLDQEFPKRVRNVGSPRLKVRDLRRGDSVRSVSLTVGAGEIVALTGLVGSGRTETVRLIFGADRRDGGTITLDGEELTIRRPRDAIRAGIALLTEDRKGQGLVLAHTVRENFGLPNLRRWSRLGWLNQRQERAALARRVDGLRIRLASPEQPAATLSGGNQQKVVLAKWLERHCDVVIFDEPTRGIDVGARYEIYQLMNSLAAEGKAILFISSELEEVLGMADRILVMHGGLITGEITNVGQATQADILALAVG